jgi:hypothetical protein
MKPASDVVDLVMPPRGHRPADRASGAADASAAIPAAEFRIIPVGCCDVLERRARMMGDRK